jgi:2-iminobutanoate/2-iminopropanoate deaminase
MSKQVIETAKFRLPPGLPFPKGIRKGNHIYVSGTVSLNEEGKLVGKGDIYQQTRQTLENLIAVVESAGGSVEDIVKINIFLKSISDFETMNRAYAEFFANTSFPARTTVEANLAHEQFLIEIEAEAILK